MEAFLKKLNLEEEYLQRFLDEGIDQESVKLLDADTLKILIPKIGPRLKFQRALALHVGNESYTSSSIEGTPIFESIESTDTDCETYSFSLGSELESILNENISLEQAPLIESSLRKKPESKGSSPDLPNRNLNLEGIKRKRELLFPEVSHTLGLNRTKF
ncbi:uncharacterized protein LOC123312972 [Coccinella septempunctata]|uniref:uncharacterized protein LOC123312972 n=1 Tax=Coccinella septempunctata TaxID=41139 RepID=UPI001D076ACC|nr:uncharacterized protein LOC123312972 [Coccinella septempunctata]